MNAGIKYMTEHVHTQYIQTSGHEVKGQVLCYLTLTPELVVRTTLKVSAGLISVKAVCMCVCIETKLCKMRRQFYI